MIFDACREPIKIPRKKVLDFHKKVAAEMVGEEYIPEEEKDDSQPEETESMA